MLSELQHCDCGIPVPSGIIPERRYGGTVLVLTLRQGWDSQDLQSAGHGAYSPGEVFLGGGTLKTSDTPGLPAAGPGWTRFELEKKRNQRSTINVQRLTKTMEYIMIPGQVSCSRLRQRANCAEVHAENTAASLGENVFGSVANLDSVKGISKKSARLDCKVRFRTFVLKVNI